jgi:outer membrane immunogenic protein
MKKLFLATTAFVALAAFGPAEAADLSRPVMKAPPVVRPACAQFGGFYLGGFGAAGYYDHTWNDRDAWTSELSDDLQRSNVNAQKTGFIGGVQGGYNWQTGCTVFGIQADYGWSSINASVTETDSDLGIDTDTLTVSSRLRGLGTVRARTGVVVDNLLLYVTGGVAFADFKRSYSQIDLNTPGTETFETRKSKWGWTLGVGTEWAMWGNWSLQSEVLYARFEKDEVSFTCAAAITCGPATPELKRFDHHDSVWISKIGLNYRFGGPAVAARY